MVTPPPFSPAAIRARLEAAGLRPSRALGQNFLADANTAARIVRLAQAHPGEHVVEVGAGIGALTVALADSGARVRAMEIDRRLVPLLEETVAGRGVDVVAADALTADWPALLADAPRWAMVSNLPYNVATPLVLEMLEHAPMVGRFLVMVQREVGERFAAHPGDAAYGAVSVKVAFHARADVVGRVPASVFVPRPRVESALVRIVRHATPPVDVADRARLFELVGAGFATRRKTLRNALRPLLGADTERVLAAAGIAPNTRAEVLTLTQWAALTAASVA
jgi:16S rRNA (adenine1518-N6/adenine1519-N6)-dimethyltransferase